MRWPTSFADLVTRFIEAPSRLADRRSTCVCCARSPTAGPRLLGGHLDQCARLRPSRHLVQLVPQSPLSQVLDACAGSVARRACNASCCRSRTPTSSSRSRTPSPGLALRNKRVVYDLLFPRECGDASRRRPDAEAPRRGTRLSQRAPYVGPNAAASPACALRRSRGWSLRRWDAMGPCAPGILSAGEVLSRVFRGKFVAGLRAAFRAGTLAMPSDLQRLTTEPAFAAWLRTLFRHEWVVYAKPPFGGPRHVLHYLARYTHRVAISNHRLVTVTDDQVTFRWKDYRHGSRVRLMTLSAEEFLRRFCLHVLPRGFVRIRFYGFLAPRCRTEALPRCRHALDATPPPVPARSDDDTSTPVRLPPCPHCGGAMIAVEQLTARRIALQAFVDGLVLDSS